MPTEKVSTYGDLAKALKSLRLKNNGKNTGQNPNPIKVPYNRIVMSDGKLGGYKVGYLKRGSYLKK
jgi:methylated-DNA-[protein]-cysteine S-methyltransferase